MKALPVIEASHFDAWLFYVALYRYLLRLGLVLLLIHAFLMTSAKRFNLSFLRCSRLLHHPHRFSLSIHLLLDALSVLDCQCLLASAGHDSNTSLGYFANNESVTRVKAIYLSQIKQLTEGALLSIECPFLLHLSIEVLLFDPLVLGKEIARTHEILQVVLSHAVRYLETLNFRLADHVIGDDATDSSRPKS